MDGGKRVLVLDDDADLRETIARLIELYGHHCVVAGQLDEVFAQRTDALGCDLAILDVNLGEAQPSGLDAYRWLLHEHFSGTVFFLTGHARTHPLVAQACEGGATLLEKPIHVSDLRRILSADAR
jgi:DNA-binding NtrC family response regulator